MTVLAFFIGALVSAVSPVSGGELAMRISEAPPGDTITLTAGIHPGPIQIDRPVTIIGEAGAVIQGSGDGDVITITAPDVTIRGVTIRGTGISLDRENAGVTCTAPRITIEQCVFEDVLFGIYLKESPGSVIRGNSITSKVLPLPRRGDGIRIWESSGTLIERNTVTASRDVVVWFSDDVRLIGNTVTHGRYGMHFMYSDRNTLEDNTLSDNSVGVFLMYSKELVLRGNICRRNRGPSGFGIGLKDMDGVVAQGNILVDNRVGINLDNSPSSVDQYGTFTRNVLAYNDIGVGMLPSVSRNRFTENTFLDNHQQIGVHGRGQLKGNAFSIDGQGNYWSDYTGFDRDGDGIGDVPYKPVSLFGQLMDRHPKLRLFMFSPAQEAVDFAARALPAIRPTVKMSDDAPLMRPLAVATGTGQTRAATAGFSLIGLASMLLVASFMLLAVMTMNRMPEMRATSGVHDQPNLETDSPNTPLLEVRHLTKRFGRVLAVDDVSLSLTPGESIALCGPNGAGKTTILRCLLGLYPCRGEFYLDGIRVGRGLLELKRRVGYVPQELSFYRDMTVMQTLVFFARIRRLSNVRCQAVLEQVALDDVPRRKVAALSGGMKQRLALACALLSDPDVLILDEPTSNLDIEARHVLLSLLHTCHEQGKAIICTSHRPEEVAQLADRVVLLENGKVSATCTPEVYLAQRASDYRLTMWVGPEQGPAAVDALKQRGWTADAQGAVVRLRMTASDKVKPVAVLAEAGFNIEDVSLEPCSPRGSELNGAHV